MSHRPSIPINHGERKTMATQKLRRSCGDDRRRSTASAIGSPLPYPLNFFTPSYSCARRAVKRVISAARAEPGRAVGPLERNADEYRPVCYRNADEYVLVCYRHLPRAKAPGLVSGAMAVAASETLESCSALPLPCSVRPDDVAGLSQSPH